jgi:hypothetical protein
MAMKLYHFCPAHMLDSIKRKGLTLGKYPLMGDGHTTFIDGIQWLTTESDPRKQSWATRSLIRYSRTAYRLTVDIPMSRARKLIRATDFIKNLAPEQREPVEAWPGSDDWYIYRGEIRSQWIKKIERMEG